MAGDVERNTRLLELPTLPASDLYTGPLHAGLSLGTLSPAGADRAARAVVITSALWGAIRPFDLIPPYRLYICAHLIGFDRIDATWRAVLPDVLAHAATEGVSASDGLVLDLRSPLYQAAGRPRDLADRTIALRIEQGAHGGRVGDVVAKRIRGEAARYVLESGADPSEPDELVGLLGERWPIELEPPRGRNKPWVMTLIPAD
jgi:uncharacterized protein